MLSISVRGGLWQNLVFIFIPFCYNESAANLLTTPALDPYGKIPEFKYCAAKIEKL